MLNKRKKIIWALSFLVFIFVSVIFYQYQKHNWPLTVEQASNRVISKLSQEDLENFKNEKEENLVSYHLGLGMWIRNEFGLWNGNIILLINTGELNPDNASQIIIENTWQELQDKD